MTEINFASKRARIRSATRSAGWSSIEGHIKYLVEKEYPNEISNLDLIISTLDRNIQRLTQLQITINDGILDVAEANLISLLNAKQVANGWAGPIRYLGDFGNSNISDWDIWDIGTSTVAGTGVTGTSFTVTGSVAGQYPTNTTVLVDGNPYTVLSATNPPPLPAPQVTTVNVSGAPPINIGPVVVTPPVKVYEYLGVGWDSDAAITQEIEAFATGYDHLTHPIGLTGTYGINERKAQLDKGSTLQKANKAAYESFIQWYDAYKQ